MLYQTEHVVLCIYVSLCTQRDGRRQLEIEKVLAIYFRHVMLEQHILSDSTNVARH